jgi:energy-coupling factor transport system permease protein
LGRRLTPVLIIAAGLTVFNTLSYGGTRAHLLVPIGPLGVYAESLSFGSSIGLRILCVAAFSAIFAYTTDPTVLVASLIHQAHMSYRLGYTVLAAYRFLPILQRELANIRDAHSVRAAYSERDPIASLGRARRYGVPLLANGIRQAERLAVAMDARGFGRQPARTYYIRPRVSATDYLFLLASVITALAILLVLARLGLLHGFLGGIAESVGGGTK